MQSSERSVRSLHLSCLASSAPIALTGRSVADVARSGNSQLASHAFLIGARVS
jgi:hypothetical protein